MSMLQDLLPSFLKSEVILSHAQATEIAGCANISIEKTNKRILFRLIGQSLSHQNQSLCFWNALNTIIDASLFFGC